MLATSNADGTTPMNVKANPTDHSLDVSDAATGSDLSGDIAKRDNNGQPVLMALSSADDGSTVPVYLDSSTGALLVKST